MTRTKGKEMHCLILCTSSIIADLTIGVSTNTPPLICHGANATVKEPPQFLGKQLQVLL